MAPSVNDSSEDFEGPWSELGGGRKKVQPRPASKKQPEPLLDFGLDEAEDWGIPGLEIDVAILRPPPKRQSEEQLADARKVVLSALLTEAMNQTEALRARIWEEYKKAVHLSRHPDPGDRSPKALQMLARARKMRFKLLGDLERQMRQVAGKIEQQHILGDENRKPEALWPIISQTLGKGLEALNIVMRIHPRDAAALEESDLELLRQLEAAPDIDLREDEWVKPGTAVIETEAGVLEAHMGMRPREVGYLLLGPT